MKPPTIIAFRFFGGPSRSLFVMVAVIGWFLWISVVMLAGAAVKLSATRSGRPAMSPKCSTDVS